jgi:hypothetical protein
LPDALIFYGFDGLPKSSLWFPETFLYNERSKVDKSIDWSRRGKDFRGFKEYHANHIEINDGLIYVTGRGRGSNNGRVVCVNKNSFLKKKCVGEKDIKLFVKDLHGPHDGLWDCGKFWLTETDGSTIAAIDHDGKVTVKKKIKESEPEKIVYSDIREFIKCKIKEILLKRPGKRFAHWTRGLCMTPNFIYVGQSTWAGDSKSRGRILKLDKKTLKIVDCFYIDIDNYPELRIFQLWHG